MLHLLDGLHEDETMIGTEMVSGLSSEICQVEKLVLRVKADSRSPYMSLGTCPLFVWEELTIWSS